MSSASPAHNSAIEHARHNENVLEQLLDAPVKAPVKTEWRIEYEAPADAKADNDKDYVSRIEFQRHEDMQANAFIKAFDGIKEAKTDVNSLERFVNHEFDVIRNELNKLKVTTVEIKPIDKPAISLGMQHMCFASLFELACAAVNDHSEPLNVWLYGPAGTGKTTAAKHVAEGLSKVFGREFTFRALSKLSTEYQVLGYQDAAGKYVSTHFRTIYEHGGVIILDEIDSWSPNAMTALNGALANGYCAFPDAMVNRHPDCIVIAGANTIGSGGTIEYVGRLKQDAASLDRFEMMEWPIDEALEAALCNNNDWLARVRHVRKQVATKGIKDVMITPRAAIKGAARIRAGISFETAEKLFLRRGMTEAQWNMVK